MAFEAYAQEVTNCESDSGPGANLAAAIAAGGRITFRCPGPATIRVTRTHTLGTSIEIDGGGQITLDGGGQVPFLTGALPQTTVKLSNLTLRRFGNPNSTAPGVASAETIVVENSRILESMSPLHGRQQVSIINSELDGNRAVVVKAPNIDVRKGRFTRTLGLPLQGHGGTVNIEDSVFEGNGRSVFNACTLRVSRSLFTGNTSELSADRLGPGAAFSTNCATTIEDSRFIGNRSEANGGAVHINRDVKQASIRRSRFEGNIAKSGGGAIAFEVAPAPQRTLEILNGTFRGNRARVGGAIHLGEREANDVRLVVQGVRFQQNVATESGGAIGGTNAVMLVLRSIFRQNEAPVGAAVWLNMIAGRTSIVANSLFALNKGAAGSFNGNTVLVVNTTFVGSLGPGFVYMEQDGEGDPPRPFLMANTIVENNSGGNCKGEAGKFTDGGTNLQFPGTSCGTTIPVDMSLLDTLYAPIHASPARGRGNNNVCVGDAIRSRDLYGERRPQLDRCSIGAVEGDLKRLVERVIGISKMPKPDLATCPPGTTGTAPNCTVKKSDTAGKCPPGMRGTYPKCTGKDQADTKCPAGMRGKPPRCYGTGTGGTPHPTVPRITNRCGPGLIGVPPYCFPVSEIPALVTGGQYDLPDNR